MPVSEYQVFKTAEMTSKIVLAGILTSSVFLICIQFSNSNPSSRLPQIRPDRHGLLELNNKEIKPLRRKRSFTDKLDETKNKIKDKLDETKNKIEGKVDETKNKIEDKVDQNKAKIEDKIEKKAKKAKVITIVGIVIGIIVLIIVIALLIYCCKK